eukprot:CAMPEP_0183327014 /NCGR_PEP_ID=MMETSP0160_2-20130417/83541_1 /TAXON_ID=2839 ORGANISM="Odontella Sinensis, Strain Grunow 1884" /NCGR_SAMPLE_ID=MMETSP0160_2 /ASSEMBLY_ACC=CAM_ASM_000250 /LENGTH=221 /DNA_ID=CAMNT_0025495123 /DNA_START=21 /DNA_END=686 /DNA_ORIENTATION=+
MGGKMGGGMGGGAKKTMPSGAKIDLGSVEEELRRKEAEKKARKAAEDERKEEERAEAIRAEREAKFEADLKKMDEAQRNAAKKQKARDAKVVRKILAASERGRHYAVLGLRGWDLKVGPWHLFQITSRDVKKAYRNAVRSVHPDKNRDGRANEAFRAVEDSAAILGDEKARERGAVGPPGQEPGRESERGVPGRGGQRCDTGGQEGEEGVRSGTVGGGAEE